MNNLSLVIRREYLERVQKKSFIITTLLMPVFMLLLSAAPALIMSLNTSDTKEIAVVDYSGAISPTLVSDDLARYVSIEQPLDSLVASDRWDGIVVIGADVVSKPDNVKFYSRDAAPQELLMDLSRQIGSTIEHERMEGYGIPDLDKILDEVKVDVNLTTLRINEKNEATESSTLLSTLIGFGTAFVLYMFLIMYGQMVMMSIIEEKNNRVLEIVVSSVKPAQLMMGKIIGVCLVAVTQVVLWTLVFLAISGLMLPAFMSPELSAEVAAYNAGTLEADAATSDITMIQALASLGNMGYILSMCAYILLFLIGGFLFYAGIYAALGSAVDNVQDGGQLQIIAILPIILGLIFAISVVNDPSSQLAVIMSFIPFTSPMVMLARVPFDIPGWQIWVSLAILYASFVAMVWLAAKIYRVGIFMYGKKPTIKELIRWATYK
ncbi:MAG: ABC transporter permease [Bacteroidales bacterium]|nr:ABC transporter permease [Bacteroidales bacterium]MCD8395120.1 ABC transporter permease [Bacteroidales bacterium]